MFLTILCWLSFILYSKCMIKTFFLSGIFFQALKWIVHILLATLHSSQYLHKYVIFIVQSLSSWAHLCFPKVTWHLRVLWVLQDEDYRDLSLVGIILLCNILVILKSHCWYYHWVTLAPGHSSSFQKVKP